MFPALHRAVITRRRRFVLSSSPPAGGETTNTYIFYSLFTLATDLESALETRSDLTNDAHLNALYIKDKSEGYI